MSNQNSTVELPPEAMLLVLTQWARKRGLSYQKGEVVCPNATYTISEGVDKKLRLKQGPNAFRVNSLRERERTATRRLSEALADVMAISTAIAAGQGTDELATKKRAREAQATALRGELAEIAAELDSFEVLTIELPSDLSGATFGVSV